MNANRQQVSARGSAIPVDWRRALAHALLSRALDDLEEGVLTPARKVLYQFSARGHDVTQVLLAQQLRGRATASPSYYRSRPLLLALGPRRSNEALASTMMRAGGFSDGRDIGVVFNLPNADGPCVLPACGGVGTQYTPAAGWAQAIRYHARGARRSAATRAASRVVHGGEASIADQRLLVGAQDRDHAAAADAVLHRGQRLRHLGALDAADAGRQHRRATSRRFGSLRVSTATAPIRPRRRC